MAKLKEILNKPVTWIIVSLVALIVVVVGVFINFTSLTIASGSASETTSFTLFNLLSSKNVDYNILFEYTFTYKLSDVTDTVTSSSSVAASYSDWSQLSSIGLVQASAFVAAVSAVLVLALQVANMVVKKEAVKDVFYVLTNIFSAILMLFGILSLVSVGLFASNVESLLFNTPVSEATSELLNDWLKTQLGFTYDQAIAAGYTVSSSSTISTTASFGMMAGPVLVCLAAIIGGLFNLTVCSAKAYR